MQGHLDIPLNERGLLQARAVSTCFDGKDGFDIKAVYCSDMSRTRDTARMICDAMRFEGSIQEDPMLREWNLGILQGKTHLEGHTNYTEVMEGMEKPEYTIPEGESQNGFQARIIQGIEAIADRHVGQTILVVCHGGVLNSMRRYTLKGAQSVASTNCSINRFLLRCTNTTPEGVRDWQWVLESWNEVEHLTTAGIEAISVASLSTKPTDCPEPSKPPRSPPRSPTLAPQGLSVISEVENEDGGLSASLEDRIFYKS